MKAIQIPFNFDPGMNNRVRAQRVFRIEPPVKYLRYEDG